MAKEVITINKPEDLNRAFEEGTLLQIKGKIVKVEKTPIGSGCFECAFKEDEMIEYCRCAECYSQRFK